MTDRRTRDRRVAARNVALSTQLFTAAELDGADANYLSGLVTSPADLNLREGVTFLFILRLAGGTTGLWRYGANQTGGWSLFFVSGVPNPQTYLGGGSNNHIVTGAGIAAGIHAVAITVVAGTVRCVDDGGAVRTAAGYNVPGTPATQQVTIGDGLIVHPAAGESVIEFAMIPRSLSDAEMQAATALGSSTAPIGNRLTLRDAEIAEATLRWRCYDDWNGGASSTLRIGTGTLTRTGTPVRNDISEEETRLDTAAARPYFHALRRFETSGNLIRHNGGAFAKLTTSATSMAVRFAKISQNNPVDVRTNNVHTTSISSSIGLATHAVRDVTLAAGTDKSIELWEDGVIHYDLSSSSPDGDSGSAYIQAVRAAPGAITMVPPVTADVLGGWGDSITSGYGVANPRDAWIYLTRADFPGRVFVEAFAGRRMMRDDTDTALFVSNMQRLFDKASSKTLIVMMGTNDCYVGNVPIATFATAYAAKLDALIAAEPTIQIFCSILPRTDQANLNGAGQSLEADWWPALEAICDARPANVTWMTPSDLLADPAIGVGTTDGVHLNAAGNIEVAAGVKSYIGFA